MSSLSGVSTSASIGRNLDEYWMDPRNLNTSSLVVGSDMSLIALTFSGSALSPSDEMI